MFERHPFRCDCVVREGEAAERDHGNVYQSRTIVYTLPYPVPSILLRHSAGESLTMTATSRASESKSSGYRSLTRARLHGIAGLQRLEVSSDLMTGRRQLTLVSRDALQKVRDKLKTLAEKRNPNAAIPQKVSRPRAIRALRREISAVFKKNYEVDDLLAVLSQEGIEIDAESFREYWRQARKKKSASNAIE